MRLFRPRASGPPFALRLLSRPGCHLCEVMLEAASPLVRERGGTLTVVNVDEDPALADVWGERIPALVDEQGRVVAKAGDSADRIRRRLSKSGASRA